MPSILNATTSSGLVTSADNSGSLQLATNNGTTAVTIDTSQNVGIGTTTPTDTAGFNRVLDIQSTNGAGVYLRASGSSPSTSYFVVGYSTSAAWLYSTANLPMLFYTNNTEQMRLTSAGLLQFNSGYGSVATAYGCRAWVNFNGSGGVTIRGSGNVTSVTRSSGGVYFVSFTNNMPDVNFCFNGSASVSSGNFGLVIGDEISNRTVSRTGTFYTVNTASVNNAADANNINIAIFR